MAYRTRTARRQHKKATQCLRWLGHLHRMEDNRIPKQAMDWQTLTGNKSRKRRRETVIDLKTNDLMWDEVAQLVLNTRQWRCCNAQRAHAHRRTKV